MTSEREEAEHKIKAEKDYLRGEVSPELYNRIEGLESLYTESSDQMAWVAHMNSLIAQAEEFIYTELIYD